MNSPNGCHQGLCPWGKPLLPSASPGGSPRSACCSDPGFFQMTASALVPEACEILCVPFGSGVFISYSPLALLKASPACLQSQMFWRNHLPGAVPLGWGAQFGSQTPCFFGRTSAIVIILPFVGYPPRGVGLDCTTFPPVLSVSLWLLLYIFSCARYFLLVFQFFLINNLCVNSCNFGVPMGEGELRVFIVLHLGHSS